MRLSERDLGWLAGPERREREHRQQVISCSMQTRAHGGIHSEQCQNFIVNSSVVKSLRCLLIQPFSTAWIADWSAVICYASPIHTRRCLQLTHFCWSGGCELVGITRTQKPGQSVRYHVSGQTLRPSTSLTRERAETRAELIWPQHAFDPRIQFGISRAERLLENVNWRHKSSKCSKYRNEVT